MEIQLARVRLKSGGRVHLAARVPEEGPVTTLCGKTLKDESFLAMPGAELDCQACRRRERDPARVSSALFEGGLGEELLQLSLARAQRAREERSQTRASPAPRPGQPRPAPPPRPEPPAPLGLKGLKQFSDEVYESPAGVILRVRREGDGWELQEVTFEGRVLVRRRADGLALEVGDVRLQFGPDGTLRAAFLS